MFQVSHLVIVGGGFSGTLLAINLLRYGTMRVTLVERRPERLGKGVAFGSALPDHILNVRAGNMSAFPDQPGHFAQWLAETSGGSDASFATRATYGRYLSALLDKTRAEAGDRLDVIDDAAVDIRMTGDGCVVELAPMRWRWRRAICRRMTCRHSGTRRPRSMCPNPGARTLPRG
jgi:uncharacterized NAD(P)/FAD-binding protein YdhS